MTSFDRGGQFDLAMRQSQPDLMDTNKCDIISFHLNVSFFAG